MAACLRWLSLSPVHYWQSAMLAPQHGASLFPQWWPEVGWHHTGCRHQNLCVFGRKTGQWHLPTLWWTNKYRTAFDRHTCWQYEDALPFAATAPSVSYETLKSHSPASQQIKIQIMWWDPILPYAFMGIPPKWNHFVDLQSACSVRTSASCPESAILHLRQEVFGKRTANIVLAAIL